MRCGRCSQGAPAKVERAKLGERDGKVAVVLGVPFEECPACGERWLGLNIAGPLDRMLDAMLALDAEITTRHFDASEIR